MESFLEEIHLFSKNRSWYNNGYNNSIKAFLNRFILNTEYFYKSSQKFIKKFSIIF